MATHVIVAIFDRAVSAYARPAFVRSQGEAIRSFIDEINRQGDERMPNAMFDHPTDFGLFFLGHYDDAKGSFEAAADGPSELISGSVARARPRE